MERSVPGGNSPAPVSKCISIKPTPAMLVLYGSTTEIAKPVATAASTALPPCFSISSPACAAKGCIAVTTPLCATTSSLSGRHTPRTLISYTPLYDAVTPPRCDLSIGGASIFLKNLIRVSTKLWSKSMRWPSITNFDRTG